MKNLVKVFIIFCIAMKAHAVDYQNVKVTGVGVVAADGRLRFTIDKAPNVIFLTDQYADEQLKRLSSLIITAYTTQSTVYLIRSSESISPATRHYELINTFMLGTYTID